MPAAVVAGKGVDLVDDHGPQVAKELLFVDPARDEHHLERLGRRQKQIGGILNDALAGGLGSVAMPEGSTAADEIAVIGQTRFQIVEEGLDRADIDHRQPPPILREHPGENRKRGRLGLSAGGGSENDLVVAGEEAGNDRVLKRPQAPPAERVDDVVLQRRMEEIEVRHGHLVVTDRGRSHRPPSRRSPRAPPASVPPR